MSEQQPETVEPDGPYPPEPDETVDDDAVEVEADDPDDVWEDRLTDEERAERPDFHDEGDE